MSCKACNDLFGGEGMLEMNDHPVIAEMFAEIIRIEVIPGDCMCLECYGELKSAYKFYQKCVATFNIHQRTPLTEIIQVDFDQEEIESYPEDDQCTDDNVVIIHEPEEADYSDEIEFNHPIEEDDLPLNNSNDEEHDVESHIITSPSSTNTGNPPTASYVFKTSGVTPTLQKFECQRCGQMCSSLYNLNRHQKIHSDNFPFKCQICPKTYFRNDSLRVHLRIKHKIEEKTSKTSIEKFII